MESLSLQLAHSLQSPSTTANPATAATAHALVGDDPQPLRHPVWDVPAVRPIVTEYRRHRLRCPRCGVTSCGPAPAGQDGPRLQAACALRTGAYRLSKAKAARLLAELFGVAISPGQVCATEAEVGQQLRPVVDEL